MAISFQKYVDITSGVGGNGAVRQRDLILRIFTINPLVPTGSMVTMESASDVSDYFGSTSEEYLRAAFYFGWISKNITRPRKITFARWVNTAVEPRLYGDKGAQSLGAWTSITSGAFNLTLGGVTNAITGMNFSTASSLSDVASIVQTAIRTQSGTMWTAATVSYNATRQSFDFIGGVTGDANIAVTAALSGDIAGQLGWLTGAILSDGSAIETLTDTLIASTDASDNFGSFIFIPTLNLTQVSEVALWNDPQNVKFQYHVPVSAANAVAWSAALIGYSGIGLTLAGVSGEYHEMIPCIVLAATNYEARNSVQNYMFQQFTLTPSVTTTSVSNTYDAIRVNYYGRTQTAGQFIDFYQRGVLMGIATDPVDMNTYGNEQWLKDAAGSKIIELLLALARVSANAQGRSLILAQLQDPINRALINGTISVGKTLNSTQKLFITEITGDELAWHQVQGIGYWLDCNIQSYVTTDGRTEYKAVYTLVYSKDDSIRSVDGTHILI